jgi:hypothetical protein
VDREKPLGVLSRFESAHLPFPLTGRLPASLLYRSHPSLGGKTKASRISKANRYFRDWTSAHHISLRFGIFKHRKLVPISAAKLDPKQIPKEESIPPSRTATVPHTGIRQLLVAAHSHQSQLVQKKLQSRQRSVAHERRSFTCPSAAATTAATHSPAVPVATAEICKPTHSCFMCRGPVLRFRTEGSHAAKAACNVTWPLKINRLSQGCSRMGRIFETGPGSQDFLCTTMNERAATVLKLEGP